MTKEVEKRKTYKDYTLKELAAARVILEDVAEDEEEDKPYLRINQVVYAIASHALKTEILCAGDESLEECMRLSKEFGKIIEASHY